MSKASAGLRAQSDSSELLPIGRMAALNCVSEKALHLYQRRGIVEPRYVDPQTGYRYYGIDQCSTLDAVSQLKALGFSLNDIEHLLREGTVAELRERIAAQRQDIERRRRELATADCLAQHLLGSCDAVEAPVLYGEIMLEMLPERAALFIDVPPVGPDDVGNARWEQAVRTAKRELVDRGFSLALFQNVSGIVREPELRKRTLVTREALIFLSDELADLLRDQLPVKTVPGGQHLTMYYPSALGPDGCSPEYPGILRMLDYAAEKGFELAGDYIGETLASTPLFGFEGRDSAFKMCLPVRRVAR